MRKHNYFLVMVTILVAICGFIAPNSSYATGILCGATTTTVNTPANYNFNPYMFLPAEKGNTFTDPEFSCPIYRLTNGMDDFSEPMIHEYSSMSPFNSDDSLIIVRTMNGFYELIDKTGKVVVPSSTLGVISGEDPVWSITDPNTLYFHSGNQIESFNVSTSVTSVIHTFTQYTSIEFGNHEDDISNDGKKIMVIGDSEFVQVYHFDTDTIGSVLDMGSNSNNIDWFDISPDNTNVVASWNAGGTGRFQGVELYDANMNFIRQVIPWIGHSDRVLDGTDADIVIIASNDNSPVGACTGNGIEKIRLSDSTKTCLMPLYWGEVTHISANNVSGQPWVLISNTDVQNGTAVTPLTYSSASTWGAYYNEIDVVNLASVDGNEVYRLAHHRSRLFNTYWYAPRAALSRDGKYVVFDSNYGQYPTNQYTDVYLINIQ